MNYPLVWTAALRLRAGQSIMVSIETSKSGLHNADPDTGAWPRNEQSPSDNSKTRGMA